MPESRRITAAPLLILMATTAFLFVVSGCQKEAGRKYSGPVEKITLGVVNIEVCSLFYIADARGLFKNNGLDVNHRTSIRRG